MKKWEISYCIIFLLLGSGYLLASFNDVISDPKVLSALSVIIRLLALGYYYIIINDIVRRRSFHSNQKTAWIVAVIVFPLISPIYILLFGKKHKDAY